MFEFLEKLEERFPGHKFEWDTQFTEDFQPLKQLLIDGSKAALWVYPEKLVDLVTGEIETAEQNFNNTLESFVKFVDEYFNPPSAKSDGTTS